MLRWQLSLSVKNTASILHIRSYDSIVLSALAVFPNVKLGIYNLLLFVLMMKINLLVALHWKQVQIHQSFTISKNIYSLEVNDIWISLPVTGCARIFSTSGVLDSAGNANVSFLAKKSENKQFTSLLHNTVTKYNSFKHHQVTDYFKKSILLLILPTRQSTNLLCISTRDSSEFHPMNPR